jgi:predicted permease
VRDLLPDVRYAARRLLRTPGFTAASVVTLALGIGAASSVFAIEEAAIFRPVREAHLEGVHSLAIADRRIPGRMPITEAQFRALESRPPEGVQVISLAEWTITAKIPGRTEQVQVEMVSGGAASMLNLRSQLGRVLRPDDDRPAAAPAVVVSDRLWRSWFGGHPDVVNSTRVSLNNIPFTVVGVAPQAFRSIYPFRRADIWIARAKWASVYDAPSLDGNGLWSVFIRSRAGMTDAQMVAGVRRVLESSPEGVEPLIATRAYGQKAVDPSSARVVLGRELSSDIMANTGEIAVVLLAFAGFVLLAACANLANMLYARATERALEFGIRRSLGATAARVFRLVLLETVIVFGLAAFAGLLLAILSLALLGSAMPAFDAHGYFVPLADVSVDGRVFLFACLCGLVAALAVGSLTAWRASHVEPFQTLANAGATSTLTRRGRGIRVVLVAVQVTAALILVMGAGVYATNTARALDRHLEFDTAPLASVRIVLPRVDDPLRRLRGIRTLGYSESRARAFYDQLVSTVSTLTDVQAATLTSGLPGAQYSRTLRKLLVADKDTSARGDENAKPWMDSSYRRVDADVASASSTFLDTIGLPLIRGRNLRETDRDGAPLVAVVSESAAAQLWPGRDPVGRRFMFGLENRWWTVVGVCADPVLQWDESPLDSPSNFALVSRDQRFDSDSLLVIRSRAPAAAIMQLRSVVQAMDDDLPVSDASTVDESILAWVRPLRASAILMTTLVAVSLGISMLGVYGVMAYLVSQRTREFGIRLALGATPRRLVLNTLAEARLLVLIGLVPGVWLTSVSSRFLQNSTTRAFLPNDISMWFAVPILVLVVGVAAAWVPARRAAGVDPVEALRDL